MTPELTWLLATAVLAASLWIPYIVGVNTSPVASHDFSRPQSPSDHAAWVHRAYRAHQNLLEQMMPFAVIVLIGHMVGVSTPVTVGAAAAFFWIRVAHAVGMISGLAGFPLRPVIFTAGWLCILVFAGAILLG